MTRGPAQPQSAPKVCIGPLNSMAQNLQDRGAHNKSRSKRSRENSEGGTEVTSWTRGHENVLEGERKMDTGDAGEKVAGAAQKAAGEVEQGADNVRDFATGEQ